MRQENVPLAYISRLLTKGEKNYTATEKEALAALWSMEKLEYFLAGREFDLITDHEALTKLKQKHLFGTELINGWLGRFNRFCFKIIHREGNSMVVADTLSRSGAGTQETNKTVLVSKLDNDTTEEIIKIHKDLSHRKGILSELKQRDIDISQRTLPKVLDKCEPFINFD